MKNFNKQSFKGKAIYKPTGKAGEYSEWACNFFTGCSHNCSYCYCKRGVMSHVWTDTPQLKKCFADYDHAMLVFERELMTNLDDLRKAGVFFSFTTDPMIPGKTLELTLRAAELALKNDVPVQILTKRADWWDSDVWEEKAKTVFINYIDKMAIGFTLTGHDDLEPGASLNSDRIEVMCLCKRFGFRTFASIEPIIDIALSEKMMRSALFHCDLFKVGLMSGGAKLEKEELKRMVDYWNPRLGRIGKKVYWKKSVVDYLGDDFTFWADSCVSADFNIFEH